KATINSVPPSFVVGWRSGGTEMNARDDPCGDEQRHRVDDQTQQEEHNPTAPTIRPTLPSPPRPAPANTSSPCERSGGASTVDVAASRAQTRQRALLTERPFSAIRPALPGPLSTALETVLRFSLLRSPPSIHDQARPCNQARPCARGKDHRPRD